MNEFCPTKLAERYYLIIFGITPLLIQIYE